MKIDYDNCADQYQNYRNPDPRIASTIAAHFADANRVLNVGAGQGAYEPTHCEVVAVELSAEMIALRAVGKAPAIQGHAGNLPFEDNTFDGSLASLTIHHWSDLKKGLAEMKRVTRGNIVLFTWDGRARDVCQTAFGGCRT